MGRGEPREGRNQSLREARSRRSFNHHQPENTVQERSLDTAAPRTVPVTDDDVQMLDRAIANIRAAGLMPGEIAPLVELRDRIAGLR
jgi:hypothetical protein